MANTLFSMQHVACDGPGLQTGEQDTNQDCGGDRTDL